MRAGERQQQKAIISDDPLSARQARPVAPATVLPTSPRLPPLNVTPEQGSGRSTPQQEDAVCSTRLIQYNSLRFFPTLEPSRHGLLAGWCPLVWFDCSAEHIRSDSAGEGPAGPSRRTRRAAVQSLDKTRPDRIVHGEVNSRPPACLAQRAMQ